MMMIIIIILVYLQSTLLINYLFQIEIENTIYL
jgi:hypothetical protein